jgi:hypothetical protein
MRFLLANTSGEDKHEISAVEIGPVNLLGFVMISADHKLDRYILHELSRLESDAIANYDVFAFNKGELLDLCQS